MVIRLLCDMNVLDEISKGHEAKWLTDGLSDFEIKWIVKTSKLFARIRLFINHLFR